MRTESGRSSTQFRGSSDVVGVSLNALALIEVLHDSKINIEVTLLTIMNEC